MAFVRVPGNIEPDGAEELWLEGRGGVRLRALLAPSPGGAPRGSVILCNGRTEFIEKYFEVIRELQARGFAVLTMDWRGQGLSARAQRNAMKGHFDTFDDPVTDLSDAVKELGGRLPRPHIVLAHSMGGAIALRALQTRRIEAEAAAFCAPMWGIANLREVAVRVARFMSSAGAGGMFAFGVDTRWKRERLGRSTVTSDRERHARGQALALAETKLQLAGVTWGWIAAAAATIEGFRRPAALAHLRMPVLVVSASKESLVDNASHEEIARILPNARHITIDGAKHEILMEKDAFRNQFWAAFDRLMEEAIDRPQPAPVIT
jgi:lysophospholipase